MQQYFSMDRFPSYTSVDIFIIFFKIFMAEPNKNDFLNTYKRLPLKQKIYFHSGKKLN